MADIHLGIYIQGASNGLLKDMFGYFKLYFNTSLNGHYKGILVLKYVNFDTNLV